jgi:4-amino-4-deoxy-L-arabinose transferase-like glycosyltransferase
MRWRDYALLIVFCTLLYGYVAVSGRPMTLHEARLPQCAREMMLYHHWLIPMNGDRPWLERPPFPHWVTIAVAEFIGCDREWSARIPPALMGLLTVLIVARMAAVWFGRGVGLLSGLALGSMYEFYVYSTHSEDDIFLAFLVVATMALFVHQEFVADPNAESNPKIFGWRPPAVIGFFVLLGLTNLAKGPIVGAAVVLGAIGVFLVFPPIPIRRWRRYLWPLGIAAATAIALSWHLYVRYKYPGAGGYVANLRYDFSDTEDFDEAWWYYFPTLMAVAMPWTPAAIVGLLAREDRRVMRFLRCWAIVPLIVLSIPHRKHHHYLVPSLAPWAILAALGAGMIAAHMFKSPDWSRRRRFGMLVLGLPGTVALIVLAQRRWLAPSSDMGSQLRSLAILLVIWNGPILAFYHGLWTRNGKWMAAAILLGFGGAFSWMQTHLPDATVADTQYLRQDVEDTVPRNKLLAINAAIGPLDFFRVQFYLRSDALLLHNLSYLRSDRIYEPDVYVVGRVEDLAPLRTLGTVDLLSRSWRGPQANVPKLALFHLTFDPGLKRYPPPAVSPMQAMMREAGPYCGPAMPEPP